MRKLRHRSGTDRGLEPRAFGVGVVGGAGRGKVQGLRSAPSNRTKLRNPITCLPARRLRLCCPGLTGRRAGSCRLRGAGWSRWPRQPSPSRDVCQSPRLFNACSVSAAFQCIFLAEGNLDCGPVPGLSTLYPSTLITALRPGRGPSATLNLYRSGHRGKDCPRARSNEEAELGFEPGPLDPRVPGLHPSAT